MGGVGFFPSPKAYTGEKARNFSKSHWLAKGVSSGHPVTPHTSYILLHVFYIFPYILHVFFHNIFHMCKKYEGMLPYTWAVGLEKIPSFFLGPGT